MNVFICFSIDKMDKLFFFDSNILFFINENILFYKTRFLKNKYHYLGFALGLFILNTFKLIYGFYTLNPSQIYSSESIINNIPIDTEQGF